MDYTPEQLEDKFNSLPTNVRETLTSVHVEERLMAIGRAHKLHLDILGELADETGLVMLGLTHPRNYVEHLSERLGISREDATALARDVNEQIFSPIREALKRVHGLVPGAATGESEQGEIGGAIPSGRVGDGDLASLEERRERLIRGELAPSKLEHGERSGVGTTAAPSSIHADKLAGPVRRPPEKIDLNAAPMPDPYREPVGPDDTQIRR
ncbi:MAG: hypothetical protein Q8R39_00070 [bacterium]|nr:hypothetical protein [bacterium]MDZ4284780.1 hypothetical protein [Patescibacteria group bacterium]